MRRLVGVLAVALVLAGACGGDDDGGSGPTAPAVVEALKADGLAVEGQAEDGDDQVTASIGDVALDVQVYGSADERNDARIKLVDRVGGDGLRVAECGRILVALSGAESLELTTLREKTTASLRKRYGPC